MGSGLNYNRPKVPPPDSRPGGTVRVPEEEQIRKAPRNILRRPLNLPPMERIKE